MNIAIFVKLIAGLIFLLVRFEYYENASKEFQLLVYSTIWLIVLSVSIICCFLYVKMIWKFKWSLLLEQCNRHGMMFVIQLASVMLCLGGVSVYTLCQTIGNVNRRVEEMEFAMLWKGLFYLTAFFRIAQRVLASKLNTGLSLHTELNYISLAGIIIAVPCPSRPDIIIIVGYCKQCAYNNSDWALKKNKLLF